MNHYNFTVRKLNGPAIQLEGTLEGWRGIITVRANDDSSAPTCTYIGFGNLPHAVERFALTAWRNEILATHTDAR